MRLSQFKPTGINESFKQSEANKTPKYSTYLQKIPNFEEPPSLILCEMPNEADTKQPATRGDNQRWSDATSVPSRFSPSFRVCHRE